MRRFLARLDDAVSPIVVRELRQAVRGRALGVILIAFLVIELATLAIASAGSAVLKGGSDLAMLELGRNVFAVLNGVLLGISLLFVPLYTGVRMAFERNDANLDLLFITTLRPRAIVAGKLAAGVCITALLFSASLPFMTFTYFLRGIDLPSVFAVLVAGFLVVVTCVQLSILLAAVPGSRVFKIVVGLLALNFLFSVFVYAVTAAYFLLESGVGSLLGTWRFWGPALALLAADLTAMSLLFALSVAAVMPSSSNRALPVRLTLLGGWLVTGAAAVLVGRSVRDVTVLGAWVGIYAVVLSLALLGGLSERDRLGPRVRRTIPAGPLRAGAFLLYSGNAGGAAFSLLLLALTFAIGALYRPLLGVSSSDAYGRVVWTLAGAALFAFAYGMTAVLVRSRVFPRMSTAYTWVIALLLSAVCSIVPALFGLMVYAQKAGPGTSLYPFLALNPFALADRAHRETYLVIVLAWDALALAFGLPWFWRRFRDFRRGLPDAPGRHDALAPAQPAATAAPPVAYRSAPPAAPGR